MSYKCHVKNVQKLIARKSTKNFGHKNSEILFYFSLKEFFSPKIWKQPVASICACNYLNSNWKIWRLKWAQNQNSWQNCEIFHPQKIFEFQVSNQIQRQMFPRRFQFQNFEKSDIFGKKNFVFWAIFGQKFQFFIWKK